jgi:predicted MFS family arabinose efflux permease
MGITAAAGSFGQFVMRAARRRADHAFGWQAALFMLAFASLAMLPLAFGLREPRHATGAAHGGQGIFAAMREAFAYPSFLLLTAGYFVCGFQVVFIGVHLPSYLKDKGIAADVAPMALALVGCSTSSAPTSPARSGSTCRNATCSPASTCCARWRSLVFISLPITPLSVYVFAATIGFLWLSTVPPTNAIVVQVFGVRHMSMLGGFVFLSHQVGSFLGVWLGGRLYDATGSYDVVWWIAIGLGIFAALVNLPVRETPILRAPEAAAVGTS